MTCLLLFWVLCAFKWDNRYFSIWTCVANHKCFWPLLHKFDQNCLFAMTIIHINWRIHVWVNAYKWHFWTKKLKSWIYFYHIMDYRLCGLAVEINDSHKLRIKKNSESVLQIRGSLRTKWQSTLMTQWRMQTFMLCSYHGLNIAKRIFIYSITSMTFPETYITRWSIN